MSRLASDKLPHGWQWTALGKVCETSGEYGSGARKVNFDGSVRYVRITDIDDHGKLKDFDAVSPSVVEPQYFLQKGDLLFARSGSVGRCYLHQLEKGTYQYAGYLIRYRTLSNILLPEYVFYIAQSDYWKQWIEMQSKTATLANINAKQFSSFQIPLPLLAEQERIVAVLNERMAAVEKARAAALEKVEAVRALSSAWLREVFSFGGGNLPHGWRWTTLGEIATAFRGVNFSSGEGLPTPEKGYTACLTTSGVQDTPAWNSRRFIPSERIKSDSQLLSAGDIMISTANSKALVGKSCLVSDVPYECAFGAFVTVIRSSAQTIPEWISQAIRTNQAKRFFYEKSSHTTNISNLKVSTLLEMPIPLPPLAEQKRIMAVLSAKIAAAEKARAAAEAELEVITALPPALLRKAFNGAL